MLNFLIFFKFYSEHCCEFFARISSVLSPCEKQRCRYFYLIGSFPVLNHSQERFLHIFFMLKSCRIKIILFSYKTRVFRINCELFRINSNVILLDRPVFLVQYPVQILILFILVLKIVNPEKNDIICEKCTPDLVSPYSNHIRNCLWFRLLWINCKSPAHFVGISAVQMCIANWQFSHEKPVLAHFATA